MWHLVCNSSGWLLLALDQLRTLSKPNSVNPVLEGDDDDGDGDGDGDEK